MARTDARSICAISSSSASELACFMRIPPPVGGSDRDFVSKIAPDLSRELDESRCVSRFGHHARARQVDLIDGLDRGRTAREHENPIGKGNRLVDVMRDK